MMWIYLSIDKFQDKVVSLSTRNIADPSFLKLLTYFAKIVDQLQTMKRPLDSVVDKPNLHLLVQLLYNAIPTIVKVRVLSEIPFETVHQPLN